jgi:hypothetical protein
VDAVTKKIVIAQANKLYHSGADVATFTEITGATVDTTDNLTMCSAFQKVFLVNGTIKKVIDFLNNKVVYSTGLTTAPLKGDRLTQATSNAAGIVDYVSTDKKTLYITKITTADFNTTNNISSDNAGGVTMDPATFVPTSATEPTVPHQSDWVMHPSKTTALPTRLYLICRYNGRVVAAGNPEKPGAWYMTRQADPFDLDFTTDLQSPVSSDNGDYGEVGDIIKALVPYHDDYLIFGCQDSIHYVQGDPKAGGARLVLSDTIGFFGDASWTFDGDGNLWFYGTGGLNKMSVSTGISKPQNISNDLIANLTTTIDADPHTHKVIMGYDKARNGIKLVSTNLSTGANKGYWIQIRPFGVWAESVDSTIAIYSMVAHNDTNPDNSALLLGGKDGFIRKEDDATKDDKGTSTDLTITSEVLLPVIPAGRDNSSKGKILSTTVITSGGASGGSSADTDGVTVGFYKADTVEEVVEDVRDGNTADYSQTITGGGHTGRIKKKIVGRAIGIKLSNSTAAQSWSVEAVDVENRKSGSL